MRGQHLHRSLALLEQLVGNQRQEVFALEGVHGQVFPQPGGKTRVDFVQNGGVEAPHVHAHIGAGRHEGEVLAILGIGRAALARLDVRALGHGYQHAVLIRLADAARHMTVFGQGVFNAIAHHGMRRGRCLRGQKLRDALKGGAAVEVVGIDHAERRVDLLAGAQHGMRGTPGLDASLGNGEAFGQPVRRLIGEIHLHLAAQARKNQIGKVGLQLRLDDQHHTPKACAHGVENGIVHQDMSGVIHRRDLLQSSKTAAHPGGHDDQNRFHLCHTPFVSSGLISIPSIARTRAKAKRNLSRNLVKSFVFPTNAL